MVAPKVEKTTEAVSKPAAKEAAPKKVAAAKPVAEKAVTPKTTAAKKPAAPKKTKMTEPTVSPEERQRMTEVAAYYIAERNGFGGDSAAYWAQAEAEIAKLLGG